MADIVDLSEERAARQPHYCLDIRCVACGYVWIVVCAVPAPSVIECPDCDREARGAPRVDRQPNGMARDIILPEER